MGHAENKALAVKALENMKGDDLYRARIQARRTDPTKEYGESGTTLNQMIERYEARENAVNEAIAWVQAR